MTQSLTEILKDAKYIWEKIISLPFVLKSWGFIVSVVTAIFMPVLLPFLIALAMMGLDVLSSIYAEMVTTGTKHVITSSKAKRKLLLSVPFIVGFLALRGLEIASGKIVVLGFTAPETLLSAIFCVLTILVEVVSILENGARAGSETSKFMAKLLRIKTEDLKEEITDKLKLDTKE